MRAARLIEAGRIELETLPDPEPGPGDVVVRVAACGICGSDLSCYRTGVFAGSVLGHEFSGIVASAGPGVAAPSVGDPVTVDPKMPCGSCADCIAGATHRCVDALTVGIGEATPGAFADLVRVPAHRAHRLPAEVAVEDACLVEPLSVALHGLARAGTRECEDAVVLGLGPIGLLTVAALRARGAGEIVGVDPVAARRTLAAALGATRALPPGDDAAAAAARVPLVFECAGKPELIQQAANAIAPGGRIALVGIPFAEATVTPLVWITKELTVIGSIGAPDEEFREALALLAARPAIARTITRRVPLGAVPDVFAELLSPGDDAKVVVDPRLG